MSNKKFNVGDKVRYIGTEHEAYPQYYPMLGTIGTVKGVDEINCYIQWAKGTTSKNDCWYCYKGDVELVKDEDMTNEEIWKMLEPKMRKNGLRKKMGALYCDNILTNGYWVYTLDDVHNAIALAYRSGYERAMKGRPFKFSEKKKKGGHWEWIEPGEIVPDGTKVRYMKRAADDDGYDPYYPKIRQECIKLNHPGRSDFDFWVQFEGSEYEYTCFNSSRDCFQKWVEDNE